MCDCAEALAFGKGRAPGDRRREEEPLPHPSRPRRPYDMRVILLLSAMLCGLLALLFNFLDRRTVKKILTIFGLGWLLSSPTVETKARDCVAKPYPKPYVPPPPRPPAPKPYPCKPRKTPKICKPKEEEKCKCTDPPPPPCPEEKQCLCPTNKP